MCLALAAASVATSSAAVQGQEPTSELTAEFVEYPEAHDGSAEFTVRVEFTDDIAQGTKNNLRRALSLTGVGVKRILRVDSRLDLFEITLVPDGDGDATVTLGPSTTDCTASEAICTSDDTALTGTITASIPGPSSQAENTENAENAENAEPGQEPGEQVQEPALGFTAEFSEYPGTHDGSAEFTLRVEFTDDIAQGTKNNLRRALSLTGVTIKTILRVDARLDLFEITLVPDGDGDATVTLGPSTTDCTASEAICTSDDTALTGTITASIPGPSSQSTDDDDGEGTGTGTDESVVDDHLDPPWTGHTVVDLSTGRNYTAIENSGDELWFRLPSLSADHVHIIEAPDWYVEDLRLRLYASNGNALSQNGRALTHAVESRPPILGSALIYFLPDNDGTYYLQVTSDSDDTGTVQVKYSIKTTSSGDSGGSNDCPDRPAGSDRCRVVPGGFVNSASQTSATGHFRDIGDHSNAKDIDYWNFYFRAGQRYEVCVTSTSRGYFHMHSTSSSKLAAFTTTAGGSSGQRICDHLEAQDRPVWVHTIIYSRQGKSRSVFPPATGTYRVSICAWSC